MKGQYLSYGDIPDIGSTCSCRDGSRVYVVISKDLNERAVSGSASDKNLCPYVFKVGSTGNNCRDRSKSMRENRKGKLVDGQVVYGEPCYAGVDDWKFLRCWPVGQHRYDDKAFKPWLTSSRFRHDVHAIRRFTTPETPGMPTDKGFIDLFVMSEAYARSLCLLRFNDPVNDQILAVVAEAIVLLIGEYVREVHEQ